MSSIIHFSASVTCIAGNLYYFISYITISIRLFPDNTYYEGPNNIIWHHIIVISGFKKRKSFQTILHLVLFEFGY